MVRRFPRRLWISGARQSILAESTSAKGTLLSFSLEVDCWLYSVFSTSITNYLSMVFQTFWSFEFDREVHSTKENVTVKRNLYTLLAQGNFKVLLGMLWNYAILSNFKSGLLYDHYMLFLYMLFLLACWQW